MYNSISALVTVIDCDKVILSAQKEKSSLELRKANLIERQENFAEASVKVEAELAEVNAQLTAVIASLVTIPEGPFRESQITDKLGYELQIRKLNERKEKIGAIAIVEKENQIKRLDQEIVEMTTFISEVETHKATIQA